MSIGIASPSLEGPRTVKDLLYEAFIVAHVLGAGEVLSLVKAKPAFWKLNELIDLCNLRKTFALYQTEIAVPMQPNQITYTIGPSTASPPADIVSGRPVEVLSGYSRRNSNDLPVFVTHAKKDYDNIQLKGLQSLGWNALVYYQAAFPLGTIYVYPQPQDTLTTLYLTVMAQLATYSSLEEEISLPPGYYQYLKYDLGKRICADHGMIFGPENEAILTTCQEALEGNNIKPFPVAGTGLSGLSSMTTGYNIISDNVRPW